MRYSYLPSIWQLVCWNPANVSGFTQTAHCHFWAGGKQVLNPLLRNAQESYAVVSIPTQRAGVFLTTMVAHSERYFFGGRHDVYWVTMPFGLAGQMPYGQGRL